MGAAVVPQRDGRPVPYTVPGVVGVIFGAVDNRQRAGLEPAPTGVTVWGGLHRTMSVPGVGVGFPDPLVG